MRRDYDGFTGAAKVTLVQLDVDRTQNFGFRKRKSCTEFEMNYFLVLIEIDFLVVEKNERFEIEILRSQEGKKNVERRERIEKGRKTATTSTTTIDWRDHEGGRRSERNRLVTVQFSFASNKLLAESAEWYHRDIFFIFNISLANLNLN